MAKTGQATSMSKHKITTSKDEYDPLQLHGQNDTGSLTSSPSLPSIERA